MRREECSDDYMPWISNFSLDILRTKVMRNSNVGNSNRNTNDTREVIRGYEEERFCGTCLPRYCRLLLRPSRKGRVATCLFAGQVLYAGITINFWSPMTMRWKCIGYSKQSEIPFAIFGECIDNTNSYSLQFTYDQSSRLLIVWKCLLY